MVDLAGVWEIDPHEHLHTLYFILKVYMKVEMKGELSKFIPY